MSPRVAALVAELVALGGREVGLAHDRIVVLPPERLELVGPDGDDIAQRVAELLQDGAGKARGARS